MLSPFSNTSKSRARWAISVLIFLVFTLISGCATGPNRNPADPLEPFNRGVYSFNSAIDSAVLKPVAQGYKAIVPQPIRTGVSNFFGNLGDLWSSVNGVLQLRPQVAGDNFVRFIMNSTFGLGGLIDVASEFGIERQRQDFGQTLGRWGIPSGPYIMLPFLGPSTLRDTVALPVNSKGDLLGYESKIPLRNSLYGTRLIDTRTGLLKADDMVNEIALDKYSFIRDAYLQKRKSEIYRPKGKDDDEDDAPPKSEEDDEKPVKK